MLCRVSRDDTRQSSLCRVSPWRHSTKNCKIIFAECRSGDTRQRLLCRVSPICHSAKRILKIKKSLSSARSRALGKARVHSKLSVLSFLLSSHSPRRRARRASPTRPIAACAHARRRRLAAARTHHARHVAVGQPPPAPTRPTRRHRPRPRRRPPHAPRTLPSLPAPSTAGRALPAGNLVYYIVICYLIYLFYLVYVFIKFRKFILCILCVY
jgi:hypothetical protein